MIRSFGSRFWVGWGGGEDLDWGFLTGCVVDKKMGFPRDLM